MPALTVGHCGFVIGSVASIATCRARYRGVIRWMLGYGAGCSKAASGKPVSSATYRCQCGE